jgi:c-di-GMP-binding flagellar brake protein YcgR
MSERRKYRRIKIKIKFIYKVMGVKGEISLASVDLGGGGIRLYLDKEIERGSVVELGLGLPGEKQLLFSLGRVVWQKKVTGDAGAKRARYLTGLEFINLGITNRTRLVSFVHERLKDGKDAT